MPDDVLRIIRTGHVQGLIIAGEIDESTYPALLQSLATLTRRGDVHIDLGGVEFCDLAGLRAIMGVTESASGERPVRHLVLHAMPPRLRRILEILGWDEMPAITFDAVPLPAGSADRAAVAGPQPQASPWTLQGPAPV